MGAAQVQASAAKAKSRAGSVDTGDPFIAGSVRPLAAGLWQRPNTGSRMSREVHVRFWERVGVKLPRATRLNLIEPWWKVLRSLALIRAPLRRLDRNRAGGAARHRL